MTLAVDALGWVGVAALLHAYWLVSTQKATGESRAYQGMNLLGAVLVLVNSSYYGAYPSVGVNAAWIAIGFYALAKHPPTIRRRNGASNRTTVDGTTAARGGAMLGRVSQHDCPTWVRTNSNAHD